MLTLMLALALSAPADPTLADLQALRQTVVDDMAAGKIPASNRSLLNILVYVDQAIFWYSKGTGTGTAVARGYMRSMKIFLPILFKYAPLLTAADQAVLVSQVNQVLVDLGP